jgi:hypothetical protein
MAPIKAGLLQNFSLVPKIQNQYYGFMYEGFIYISRAGTYTFYTNSDDGSRLWINDTLVVENGGIHLLRERSGTINLPVGYHALRVSYFQNISNQNLVVSYKGPQLTKRNIPNSALFYK